MVLIAYIVLMVMCVMMIIDPKKATQKSVAKQEAKKGTTFTQEELDKKYKNVRIFGIIFAVAATIIMFI